MLRLLAALCALCLAAFPASAQERGLHYGLLFTNDSLGDGEDRWRTGSFASSLAYAPGWSGALPRGLGQLWELRVNGQVIAPSNLQAPAPQDRVYAQALSFGLHTHFQPNAIEYSLGGDLVVTGPITQLDHLQEIFHDIFGGRGASPAAKAAQISDDLDPALVVEAGREFRLGHAARLRPFIEARAGVETLVRAGADLTFGRFGAGGLLVRSPVTGQRFSVIQEDAYQGVSLFMGADIAHVASSEFIPSSGAARLRDTRSRARAGMHWRNRSGTSLFYGLTWLGKEFATQSETQVVGSMQLRVKF
ncbi:lipid A-modifier LpxR family protein [Roseovarius salis]|uniref:lipid A-modifier LpxR family protein n=1 Tax=Roseovarius salis TaxID=3376063 RepID=UPI0037CBD1A7